MRKARHPQIRFYVGSVSGHFNFDGWVNEHNTNYCKKTSAIAKANLIFSDEGQVYIKVTYSRKFYNDGIYTKRHELIELFPVLTEKPLLDYALEKNNNKKGH